MYLISAEGYKNAGVHILIKRKTGELQVSVKNVHNGLSFKNISDQILKEIYGIYETKNLTNQQIQKYKMTERELFEKYDHLSKDELNTNTNINFYVINDDMSTVIKRYRGEKNRQKKNRWI